MVCPLVKERSIDMMQNIYLKKKIASLLTYIMKENF